jgi:hypothetical protein
VTDVEKLQGLVSFAGLGLIKDQQDYVKQLAVEAGWGAWATSAAVVARSQAYLNGLLTEPAELKDFATTLLNLAAYDSDHEWEAPSLTGRPTEYAIEALEKINKANA